MTERQDPSIRILLIDDETLVRASIRLLLETWPGFEIVGEAGSPDEAVGLLKSCPADVILLTLPSPMIGQTSERLEALGAVTRASEGARVLLLTGEPEPDIEMRAIRLGARGVLSKQKAPQELRKAVQKVHSGEFWLGRKALTAMITEGLERMGRGDQPPDVAMDALSRREQEVTHLVAKGLTNREIGRQLSISEATVRHHVTAIFNKLAVSNRFELIAHVYQRPGR